MRRIVKIPDGMTWKEFKEKYFGFFPVSNKWQQIQKLKDEFERLTGKKVR